MRPSRAPARDAELRVRILHEATTLFAEKGYAGTSVREVVERCGCTKPALYYYFRNKEALFLEAVRIETGAITALMEDVAHEGDSTYEQLALGIQMWVDHVREDPMGMRFLMRAELWPEAGQPDFDFDSLRTLHMRMVQDMLSAGIERGEIREGLDLEDAAYALAGMVDQRVQLWLWGEPLPEDLADRILGLLFNGISA